MATSSAAIPPTRRGKSGHFTVHSTAAKSCISNKRPAALDNVRLPALVSRLLFDRITHWPRSSPKSEGRDVPESPPSRRLSMNRPALSSVIAFAVVLGLAVTAQAQSGGWPVYGGDPGNTRYSTLTQINPGNVKNLKVAGFGGGEYGARGYIAAYDQADGREVWRFYTVPGPGEPGNDSWKGDSWKYGGAVAWAIGSYDPALNLIYYGTSNPAPWNAAVRGPDSSNYGQFTNLFSSSTVALDADTGKLAWFYQSTPHDAWDYDGVNENVLADVEINGQKTPVLFKADRNGFFYVLNRKTGQLISAKLFATANWTSGMDMTTGRPIEVPEKRPRLNFRAKDVCPSAIGNKNWMPMSYSPQTGLVYMPTLNICMDMNAAQVDYKRGAFYLGADFELGKWGPGGHLGEVIAWDPIKQQKVWGNTDLLPYFGGIMTMVSGFLFHGDIHGWFKALDAKTGQTLWKFMAGSGISAAPITYAIDGKQYVAVVSGRTFAIPPFFGKMGEQMVAASPEGGALFVFELPSP